MIFKIRGACWSSLTRFPGERANYDKVMKGDYQTQKTLFDMHRLEIRPCIAVCITVFVYEYQCIVSLHMVIMVAYKSEQCGRKPQNLLLYPYLCVQVRP